MPDGLHARLCAYNLLLFIFPFYKLANNSFLLNSVLTRHLRTEVHGCFQTCKGSVTTVRRLKAPQRNAPHRIRC